MEEGERLIVPLSRRTDPAFLNASVVFYRVVERVTSKRAAVMRALLISPRGVIYVCRLDGGVTHTLHCLNIKWMRVENRSTVIWCAKDGTKEQTMVSFRSDHVSNIPLCCLDYFIKIVQSFAPELRVNNEEALQAELELVPPANIWTQMLQGVRAIRKLDEDYVSNLTNPILQKTVVDDTVVGVAAEDENDGKNDGKNNYKNKNSDEDDSDFDISIYSSGGGRNKKGGTKRDAMKHPPPVVFDEEITPISQDLVQSQQLQQKQKQQQPLGNNNNNNNKLREAQDHEKEIERELLGGGTKAEINIDSDVDDDQDGEGKKTLEKKKKKNKNDSDLSSGSSSSDDDDESASALKPSPSLGRTATLRSLKPGADQTTTQAPVPEPPKPKTVFAKMCVTKSTQSDVKIGDDYNIEIYSSNRFSIAKVSPQHQQQQQQQQNNKKNDFTSVNLDHYFGSNNNNSTTPSIVLELVEVAFPNSRDFSLVLKNGNVISGSWHADSIAKISLQLQQQQQEQQKRELQREQEEEGGEEGREKKKVVKPPGASVVLQKLTSKFIRSLKEFYPAIRIKTGASAAPELMHLTMSVASLGKQVGDLHQQNFGNAPPPKPGTAAFKADQEKALSSLIDHIILKNPSSSSSSSSPPTNNLSKRSSISFADV